MMEFNLTVQVERIQGKFATRDAIEEALVEAVQEADVSGLDDDGESEYEVTDVTPEEPVRGPARGKVRIVLDVDRAVAEKVAWRTNTAQEPEAVRRLHRQIERAVSRAVPKPKETP